MTLVLVVALVAPALGALAAVALPERATTAVRVAALVAAGAWLVLLVDASLVSAGGFHSAPLVAAGALGAALVAAAVDVAFLERPALVGVALAALTVGLAGGRTATDSVALVAGVAVGVATAAVAARPIPRVWATGAAGVAAGAVGALALGSAANSWSLPPPGSTHRGEGLLLLVSAALLVLCGSERARAPAAVLVPAGLFLGALAAPLARGADGSAPLALALAVLACAAAAAARAGRPLLERPVAGLALLSLAALAAPGATRPAGLLLGAAATLAAALGMPAAAVFGVPGGVALAVALAGRGGAAALAESALAAAVALALAAAAVRARAQRRPSPWAVPALAAGAWLLLAPGLWAWVGPGGLRPYDLGAARAAAGAGLCLAVVAVRSRISGGWYARSSPQAPEDAVHH